MKRNKDLKLVVTADGAMDNWKLLETINPDMADLDFWHAACGPALESRSHAYFGPDGADGINGPNEWHHILRHDPNGVNKIIDSLRYLLLKGSGCDEINRGLKYSRNNRKRMNYEQVAKSGYPIGSGTVKAANKVLTI